MESLDLDLNIMYIMRREDMVDKEPVHRAAMVAKLSWTTSTPGVSMYDVTLMLSFSVFVLFSTRVSLLLLLFRMGCMIDDDNECIASCVE